MGTDKKDTKLTKYHITGFCVGVVVTFLSIFIANTLFSYYKEYSVNSTSLARPLSIRVKAKQIQSEWERLSEYKYFAGDVKFTAAGDITLEDGAIGEHNHCVIVWRTDLPEVQPRLVPRSFESELDSFREGEIVPLPDGFKYWEVLDHKTIYAAKRKRWFIDRG